ncbi:MAG: Crp/Fnr family transcriptional regulator [Chloroflexota bacterium]
MDDLIKKLSQAEVFEKFTHREREELTRLATRRVLKKGSILCWQGDPWPHVLYIESGLLKAVIGSPDGGIYVVSTWEDGVGFWGHTLFDDDGMPSTIEAVEDTIVYQWQGNEILEFAIRNSDVTLALLRRWTRLIRKRKESIYNLVFSPVAGRLAKLIIDKFIDEKSPTVQRDLTLEDMASMIASSPEVICRILYQFQDSGFLHVDRATITLRDRQGLENLLQQG